MIRALLIKLGFKATSSFFRKRKDTDTISIRNRRIAVIKIINKVTNEADLDKAWDAVYAFRKEFKWDYRTMAYVAFMAQLLHDKKLSLIHSKVQ